MTLIVGSPFPYIKFLPKPSQARGVQIDLDPVRIGLRYPVEVGLVGDSRSTLRELLPLLAAEHDGDFLQRAREPMQEWRAELAEQGERMDKPMKPQVVAWELDKRLAPNAIVSFDSGTNTTWFARLLPVQRGHLLPTAGRGGEPRQAASAPPSICNVRDCSDAI
jgi:pyruvate dehydrogenase (quinone)